MRLGSSRRGDDPLEEITAIPTEIVRPLRLERCVLQSIV